MRQPMPPKQQRRTEWHPTQDELRRLLAEVRPVIAELAREQSSKKPTAR